MITITIEAILIPLVGNGSVASMFVQCYDYACHCNQLGYYEISFVGLMLTRNIY